MTTRPTSARPPSHAESPTQSEAARLQSFGRALRALHDREMADMGEADVRYIVQLDRFSHAMEVVGRTLLHTSLEPVGFLTGVTCLWVHKQLQATEIGHTVLHGVYDRLDDRYRSDTFVWQAPIDEDSWRNGHNLRHHQFTNVAHRDPDINFGGIRLTEETPHRAEHYHQLGSVFFVSAPFFTSAMNAHFTGLMDVYGLGGWEDEVDVIDPSDPEAVREAHRRAFGKLLPHLAKEYLLFPALAGPMFWKVALGNWLSERARDLYTAATIYCGHVGEDVASYPPGTRAGSRGRWYEMQVESSNNFTVAWPFNVLCGGLEHQIEHHLFPKLPPQRLRAIAPEVEAICQDHGVAYRSEPWGRTLLTSLRRIAELSFPKRAVPSTG
ncbi:MAG: fatty acid desaturase [Myxococcota bacterium]